MQRNTSRFSDHASGQRCARIGEARDLLPYAHCGDVEIDDVTLTLRIPDHPRRASGSNPGSHHAIQLVTTRPNHIYSPSSPNLLCPQGHLGHRSESTDASGVLR